METRLSMDSKSKHLNLNFKKKFEHSSDVQLKVRGVLDTQTATGQFDASLNKFVRLGALPTTAPDTRLRIGVGAKAFSERDDVLFTVNAKKVVVVNKRRAVMRDRVNLLSYTQLALRANYDYNVRSEKWSGEASAQASHAMFGFSQGQDLRLTAGYRAQFNQRGLTAREPFLRVQENCWSIQTTFKGDWMISYDL